MMKDQETRAQSEKIQSLLDYFEQETSPETHSHALELVRALMDLHGNCFSQIVSAIADRGDPGKEILNSLIEDEAVSGLLILYGLHPLSLTERVKRAVEDLTKTLKSHNATVELIAIAEGVVRLRLTANGNGCHSSASALKQLITETMMGVAPDAGEMSIEEVAPEPKIVFVPLESLSKARSARGSSVAKTGSLR